MSLSVKPQLFIITGSNGAGKSTLKQALLPPEFSDLDIFDGDIFYTQKSTEFYKQHGSSKEAKKQANESLHILLTVLILLMKGILPVLEHGLLHSSLKRLASIFIWYSVGLKM
ncbi:hypothetical protein [Pedobacter antarcticus]|uniref:hypothetical protein n=1 Tax=Pedobacter antarcticus TaxID=34086 RepID=UPI002930A2D1|nr:hypothetical protein [Pedobacter antarcticus]